MLIREERFESMTRILSHLLFHTHRYSTARYHHYIGEIRYCLQRRPEWLLGGPPPPHRTKAAAASIADQLLSLKCARNLYCLVMRDRAQQC